MENLSAYVLTKNSEAHLRDILHRLSIIADEILIIDSGSTDNTKAIATSFDNVKFFFHEFRTFREQRTIAADACSYDMVLWVDSDEIPDFPFIHSVQSIQQSGFGHDAYRVARKWSVLGKFVHSLLPITSPDFPVRLYRKSKVAFADSTLVHETPSGYRSLGMIEGCLNHITFKSRTELHAKLELYTGIAAQDLVLKERRVYASKIVFSPLAAFVKWYLIKGGFKDGWTGVVLGIYAYQYTLKKYLKAKKLIKAASGA